MSLELYGANSLEKIFISREKPSIKEYKNASCLKNEIFSYQIVYRYNHDTRIEVVIETESDISDYVTLREVGYVPSEMPCFSNIDEDYLKTEPGLYPDPLYRLDKNCTFLQSRVYKSIWVTVEPKEKDIPAGIHDITVLFKSHDDGKLLNKHTFELTVIDRKLPKQDLIHTEWLHCDSIANYYNVEVFSEEFWKYVRQFIRTAVKNGINTILTPLFTPPLDTKIGGERKTVQLIDVTIKNNEYKFGFDKLQQWIDMCHQEGVSYFEFSHLFSQWGAKFAPKVMANIDGKYQKLFGWETSATSEEYTNFLCTFIPQLKEFVYKNNVHNKVFFHISDEPEVQDIEGYKAAKAIVEEELKNFTIIDALSSYDFYKEGIITNPIPATNHIEPFIENRVNDLWTYYCCGQGVDVSNRFFSMPSSRNRIIGVQLYKYDIVGFLHWGYNFYNTQYSLKPIDPYLVTDAQWGFPSGDAFVVYPGENGEPVESLRLVVFNEALQDLRAFKMLEQAYGKAYVMNLIELDIDDPITFKKYPKSIDYVLDLREKVNRIIARL